MYINYKGNKIMNKFLFYSVIILIILSCVYFFYLDEKIGDKDYEIVVFKNFLEDYKKFNIINNIETLNKWEIYFHSKTKGYFLNENKEYFIWNDEVDEKLHSTFKEKVNYFDGGNNYEKDIKKYYNVTVASISLFLRKNNIEELVSFLTKKRTINNWENKNDISYLYWRDREDRENIRKNLMKIIGIDIPKLKGKNRQKKEIFNEAVKIQENYKFSIAIEGYIKEEYITEKIVNSFLSGSIPIYKGSPSINKYFNKNSFINIEDFENLEEAGEHIKKVKEDKKLAYKYLSEPPCTDENIKNLLWWRYK